MSGSGAQVTVSPESKTVVFSGMLLKAPPLDRKGKRVSELKSCMRSLNVCNNYDFT